MYLCVSVTFLDAAFHGVADNGPEWPPSPLRLFQALLAGACRGCPGADLSQGQSRAFRWLELLPPPTIVAPVARPTRGATFFVPNNDSDQIFDRQARLKGKMVAPHLLADKSLHYLFVLPKPTATDVAEHLELLKAAARSITHLGWGIDMVAARAELIDDATAAKLPGKRWSPAFQSSIRLRAPKAGILDALIDHHDAFLHRVGDDGYVPVPPLGGFDLVAYDDADRLNRRPFASFDLLPVDPADARSRLSFRQERTVCVAAMLRHAACEAVKGDLDESGWRTREAAEQFVAGHGVHSDKDSFARFSYLPIPTLNYGDGMIRRAMLAETAGGEGNWARWAQQRLAGFTLQPDEKNTADAPIGMLSPVDAGADKVFKPFIAESDRWQTVTPIILPGFDDNNRAKRLKLLLRCFEQVGIPREAIADVDVQKSPWLRASAQPRAYRRSLRLLHLPACHVRVYFKRPLWGPLAIGAGRHRGLGLFAAWD